VVRAATPPLGAAAPPEAPAPLAVSRRGGSRQRRMSRLNPLEWSAASAAASATTPRREIAMAEVREHRTERDAWIAVRGKAYDVSTYLDYHPGGARELMRGAGLDATALFEEYHRWVNAEGLLRRCLVGTVARPVDPATGGPPRWPSLDSVSKVRMVRRARVSGDTLVASFVGAGAERPWRGVWHVRLRVSVGGRVVERAYTPLPPRFADATASAEYPVEGAPFAAATDAAAFPADGGAGGARPLSLMVKEYTSRRAVSWCVTHAPLPADVLERGGSLQGEAQPDAPAESRQPWLFAAHVGLVCAGTAIAPALQILCAALEDPGNQQRFCVVWANRDAGRVPFHAELAQLAREFPSRLRVLHVLSGAAGESGGEDEDALARLSHGAADVSAVRGRVDAALLRRALADVLTAAAGDPVAAASVSAPANACVGYCGSWDFERAVRVALLSAGFPSKCIAVAP